MIFHEGAADWERLIRAELGGDGPGWEPQAGHLEAGAPAPTSDLAFFSKDRRAVVLGMLLVSSRGSWLT